MKITLVMIHLVFTMGCASPSGDCKIALCTEVCSQSSQAPKSAERDLGCVRCVSNCERVR